MSLCWRELVSNIESNFIACACRYCHAIAVFVWFQRGDNKSTENVRIVDTWPDLPHRERLAVAEHLAASFVNAALVLSTQRKFAEVVYACTKALYFDAASAKALCCRAKVRTCCS